MADETPKKEASDETFANNPLAAKVARAIKAHPVLRDQKKLVVSVVGRRVRVEGFVFTRDMHRQLVEMLARIPGAEEIVFSVEPEIKAPGDRELEGRVPPVSPGPLPSSPDYSTRRPRKPT